MKPTLSIIVPTYNRSGTIVRCLESIFQQAGPAWDGEVIMVDDCSRDDTVALVQARFGERVRIVLHEVNQGVGPARNTGAKHARNDWLMFLDSDDELAPGGEALVERRMVDAKDDIHRIRFMVRLDNGQLSPFPPHREETWDYESYLCNQDAVTTLCESISIYRRSIFSEVHWANDRCSEGEFHLECFKRYKALVVPDVVRLYHQNTGGQISSLGYGLGRSSANRAGAAQVDRVIAGHGPALRRCAPRVYTNWLESGCRFHLLLGNRAKGVGYGMRALAAGRIGRVPAYLSLGLVSPRLLAWVILQGKRAKRGA